MNARQPARSTSNSKSSKGVHFESYLVDHQCVFKNMFILTDISFNVSLVKPIKLSIPKQTQNVSNPPPVKEQPVKPRPKPTTEPPPENIESPTVTNSNDNISQTIQNDNNEQNSQPKIPQNIQSTNSITQIELKANILFQKIPNNSVSIFYLKVNKNETWSIVPIENPSATVISVLKVNKVGSAVKFKTSHPNLSDVNVYSSANNSFYSVYETPQKNYEIAAVRFNKINKELKIRQFQAFVPVKDVMVSFQNASLLLNEETKNKIEMRPRPPKLKGGIPVLYFGGRIKKESIQNFILQTSDETVRFIFGKVDEETFVGEVYHPLSPMQAITIALASFK